MDPFSHVHINENLPCNRCCESMTIIQTKKGTRFHPWTKISIYWLMFCMWDYETINTVVENIWTYTPTVIHWKYELKPWRWKTSVLIKYINKFSIHTKGFSIKKKLGFGQKEFVVPLLDWRYVHVSAVACRCIVIFHTYVY